MLDSSYYSLIERTKDGQFVAWVGEEIALRSAPSGKVKTRVKLP